MIGRRIAKDAGRKDFHVRAIRRSYRIRGIVARTQMNKKAKKVAFNIIRAGQIIKNLFPFSGRKKNEVIRLIKRIFKYSAIKISANVPLLYSVLNPETNSDSPSAKSKGVRFVSAKMVANHIKSKGGIIKAGKRKRFVAMSDRDVVINIIRGVRRIRTILISYEIVWATPRKAPSSAYFELEDQPAPKVV